MTPGSIMPAYPWLLGAEISPSDVSASMTALARVGTPYSVTDEASVTAALEEQGAQIVGNLSSAGVTAAWDDEIVALTAYLQRLGREGKTHLAAQQGGGR